MERYLFAYEPLNKYESMYKPSIEEQLLSLRREMFSRISKKQFSETLITYSSYKFTHPPKLNYVKIIKTKEKHDRNIHTLQITHILKCVSYVDTMRDESMTCFILPTLQVFVIFHDQPNKIGRYVLIDSYYSMTPSLALKFE